MGLALIQIHIQGPDGSPLAGVVLNATSPTVGPWSGVTDCAGNFIPMLSAAHYDIRLTKAGYKEMVWPTDLADCGVITQAMEYENITPTRDKIINVQGNFLNLFDSDDIPIWDIYLATLYVQNNMTKFNEWLNAIRVNGGTHVNLAISYNYDEQLGWINRYPFPGQDFTLNKWDIFREVVREVRSRGFIPIIKLAMDGQDYDPIGWTHGWNWAMSNMDVLSRETYEFNESALFSTGFDGCFPNWSPAQTKMLLQKMRMNFGEKACIDTEFSGPGTTGYIHMGNGAGDWVPDSLGILDSFSAMSMVIPPDSTGIQQISSRLLGPASKNIDPSNAGPWYLQQMNAIKKINMCMYETCAFDIIRKKANSVQAKQIAQFCNNFGWTSFGNGTP